MSLGRELESAAFAVTRSHLRRLNGLGVSWETIGELGRDYHGFGLVRCSEDADELFCLGDGEQHLVLPVHERGEVVDLCAFRSDDPARWLLRTGCGWALGLERGLERHTWADSVPLSESPLDWLCNGANGLCVIDWDAPEVTYLTELPHIVCSTEALGRRLQSALARPPRLPSISVRENRLAA